MHRPRYDDWSLPEGQGRARARATRTPRSARSRRRPGTCARWVRSWLRCATSTGTGRNKQVRFWHMTVIGEVRLGAERRGRRAPLDIARRCRDTAHLRSRPRARAQPRRNARGDHLPDPPREGRRPRHVARRRPPPTAHRAAAIARPGCSSTCCTTRPSIVCCRARSCGAWRPSCRSPACAASRSSRSRRSPRARRLDEALALVRKHSVAGRAAVHARRRHADAARPLRVGGRRHPQAIGSGRRAACGRSTPTTPARSCARATSRRRLTDAGSRRRGPERHTRAA